ncbi:diacylglycerol kinase family lipid kinase, partial [bacterium]|nr:diacylglycerol kinase family lipid kinase [candidate division CSSED10-310 bacterium]
IREGLRSRHIEYRMEETRHRGDAERLARSFMQQGFKRFLIAGGDGTVHEAVNGLMADPSRAEECVIGQLPLGTGNDWIRSLGLPVRMGDVLDLVAAGRNRPHDGGVVIFPDRDRERRRYFVTVCGIGFDAQVASSTDRKNRASTGGRWKYLASIFQCLRARVIARCLIDQSGQTIDTRCFSMTAAVGPYSGGGMCLSPRASFDDGLLDITVIGRVSMIEILFCFPLIYSGSIHRYPRVRTWRTNHLTLTSDPVLPIHVDGEVCGTTPVTIRSVRHAFQAVAP